MFELTESAWDVLDAQLDDSRPELDALLVRIRAANRTMELELEAAINAHVNTMVRQAFRLGFNAARNPEPFIFAAAARQASGNAAVAERLRSMSAQLAELNRRLDASNGEGDT